MKEKKEEIANGITSETPEVTATPKPRKPRTSKATKIVQENSDTIPGADDNQKVVSVEPNSEPIISEEITLEEIFAPKKDKTKKDKKKKKNKMKEKEKDKAKKAKAKEKAKAKAKKAKKAKKDKAKKAKLKAKAKEKKAKAKAKKAKKNKKNKSKKK
jgi:hypothetical protein